MDEISIGEVLRLRRKALSVSKKNICNGICSHTAYTRYENNERLPGKLVCDLLLQRLGFDSAKVEYAISIKLAEDKSSIEEKINRQQEIVKYNLSLDCDERKEQLEKAWKLTRKDELYLFFQNNEKLLGDIEAKILQEYILLEKDNEDRLKALYGLKETLVNGSYSKEKQEILIDILIEIYKEELKLSNKEKANNAIELAREIAINNYDLKALSKIYGLQDSNAIEDELDVLFTILISSGADGIISEEGQRLWESTINQKLSDIVELTTI